MFCESNVGLQTSFTEEREATKARLAEENRKLGKSMESKLAAVFETKWKREKTILRQFEFNQNSIVQH